MSDLHLSDFYIGNIDGWNGIEMSCLICEKVLTQPAYGCTTLDVLVEMASEHRCEDQP